MFHQNVSSKYPIKMSPQNVSSNCLIKMSYQNVSSKCLIKCLIRTSHQNVSSKCLIKMSHQNVSSKCLASASAFSPSLTPPTAHPSSPPKPSLPLGFGAPPPPPPGTPGCFLLHGRPLKQAGAAVIKVHVDQPVPMDHLQHLRLCPRLHLALVSLLHQYMHP